MSELVATVAWADLILGFGIIVSLVFSGGGVSVRDWSVVLVSPRSGLLFGIGTLAELLLL